MTREEALQAVREAIEDYHAATGERADDLSLALALAEMSTDEPHRYPCPTCGGNGCAGCGGIGERVDET
jgi:hypothetical protein